MMRVSLSLSLWQRLAPAGQSVIPLNSFRAAVVTSSSITYTTVQKFGVSKTFFDLY